MLDIFPGLMYVKDDTISSYKQYNSTITSSDTRSSGFGTTFFMKALRAGYSDYPTTLQNHVEDGHSANDVDTKRNRVFPCPLKDLVQPRK